MRSRRRTRPGTEWLIQLLRVYTSVVVDLLAARAPVLLKTLREHEPDFVLLDGALVECERVGDGQPGYSPNAGPTA